MGILDLFTGDADRRAAEANKALAAQYKTDALGAQQTGYDTGTAAIDKSVAAFDPLVSLGQKYGRAGDLNLDALGVNGAEGTARATGAFQTTPGYDLTQKAALEAIDRRRAGSGMYASGNADIDTANWVTKNLYETQYAPWLSNLAAAGREGGQYTTTAAGGQAGGYTNLASLAGKYADNQSNIFNNVTQTGIGANNQIAAGEVAAGKNLLGAGLSLASLAIPGGGSVGGALMSGAGNLFGNAVGGAAAPSGGYTGFTSFGR